MGLGEKLKNLFTGTPADSANVLYGDRKLEKSAMETAEKVTDTPIQHIIKSVREGISKLLNLPLQAFKGILKPVATIATAPLSIASRVGTTAINVVQAAVPGVAMTALEAAKKPLTIPSRLAKWAKKKVGIEPGPTESAA